MGRRSTLQACSPEFPLSCKAISFYPHGQTLEALFSTTTITIYGMRDGVSKVDLFSPSSSVCMSAIFLDLPTMSSWLSVRKPSQL